LLARLATALPPYWTSRALGQEAKHWLDKCIEQIAAFPPRLRANVYSCAGQNAVNLSEWDESRRYYTAALEEFKTLGHALNVATIIANLGVVALGQGAFAEAERYLSESVEHHKQLNYPKAKAQILNNLASVRVELDELIKAEETYREALSVCAVSGDQRARATALDGLAMISYLRGENTRAEAEAQESLELNQQQRSVPALASNAMTLGCLANRTGDLRAAAKWLSVVDSLARTTTILFSKRLENECVIIWKRLRAELPHDVLSEEMIAGQRIAKEWRAVDEAA
jgi:tetratricopeptide (TPR) repeat protein